MDYKYNYDPESNILSITMSDQPFDYAEQTGDFIVHFDLIVKVLLYNPPWPRLQWI